MAGELGKSGKTFWGKMRQLEVEFYRIQVVIADGSGKLKEEISSLFHTLRKVYSCNNMINKVIIIIIIKGGSEPYRNSG